MNTAISTLRRVFGETRDNPAYILTVPRRGYKLLVEPESVEETAAEPPTPAAPRRGLYRAGLAVAGLGAFVVAVVIFVTGLTANDGQTPQQLGVVVNSFENPKSNADLDYLAFGLTEEVRRALSRRPDVNVAPSRQQLLAIRGENITDILDIDGTLETEGDRISVALSIRSNDRVTEQPFTRTISGTTDSLLALRKQILDEVGIGIRIMDKRRAETTQRTDAKTTKDEDVVALSNAFVPPDATSDEKAYEHYLIGSYLFWRTTPEDYGRAIWHMEQAVARDPLFAQAYEGLGTLYFYAGSHYGQVPNDVALPKAREALRTAIELDPELVHAFATYADLLLCSDHDVDAAGKALEQALRIDPDLVHMAAVRHKLRTGDIDGMVSHLKEGLARFPDSAWQWTVTGWHYFEAGSFGKAREAVDRAVELNPAYAEAHRLSGRIHVAQGNEQKAIEAFDKSVTLAQGNERYRIARAIGLARLGHHDKALAEFADLKASKARINPVHETMLLAATGRTDEALTSLERAAQDRQIGLCYLDTDPAYEPLRGTERFQTVRTRLNFE